MPEEPAESKPTTGIVSMLPLKQRIAAVTVGALASGGGIAAVFLTDNQAGTAALFVIGAVFLACGVFALKPDSITVGGGGVQFARAAIATVERLATDADPEVRDKVVATLGDELESRGISRTEQQLAESVINGFVRAGSDQAREIEAALRAAGWQPSSPPRSRYVLWRYTPESGRSVSLFQNVNNLAVSKKDLRPLVRGLPGATETDRDVRFGYGADTDNALRVADTLKSYANG